MSKSSSSLSMKSKGRSSAHRMLTNDTAKLRGNREFREVSVETFESKPQNVGGPDESDSGVASTSKSAAVPAEISADRVSNSSRPSSKTGVDSNEQVPFYSGNPFVEKTEGILHLYKQDNMTSMDEHVCRSEMIAMLAVPAKMSTGDLLQFLAPVLPGISLLRIVRDSSPNQYMVLVKFRNQSLADDFYTSFNGIQYNSIETDVCHLAFVEQVETMKEAENASAPIDGHTELPTCPVCLERMDESVDGVLTILCNHAFHSHCLSPWGDATCPVCRYAQTPELTPEHACVVCAKQEDLWICLICGHIGCGRYAEAHAQRHFEETGHTYSLQAGGQRVWDYTGDNYVHRLMQNKTDGKLVEYQSPRNAGEFELEEKMDAMTLEYTYLLTSQLESQRLYFEEKLARIEKISHSQVEDLEAKIKCVTDELAALRAQLAVVQGEKVALERKVQKQAGKLAEVQSQLTEEQAMNVCLRGDQSKWSTSVKDLEGKLKETIREKDQEINDLREQLRDLMFHLEAEAKLAAAPVEQQDEIRDGHVELPVEGAAAEPPHGRKNRRRNK